MVTVSSFFCPAGKKEVHLLKKKRKKSRGMSILCHAMEFGYSLVPNKGTEKLLTRNDLSRLDLWKRWAWKQSQRWMETIETGIGVC